ncbi:Bug family tripartite tricarboxylate transporter substrate binding protein [Acidovorax soli]|uniref:Bug family tripartite tricarboxylate transporter substrate binding protein n=1 Tax=Acidovorax TaxID=12916 RepID=UPI0026F0B5E2|nr:tripartite tricarboxylate transporter substrate-binding protein [Acidovorax soli]MCM2346796.1 tripartite tricarboxylate transporter substrate-binding protein [Acidovorax soli]
MTPSHLRRAALALALAAACSPAFAQSTAAPATPGWPSKPVKLVVGFPGGSSPDLVARTLAEPLAKALGQPVIVENKVGAGGNIAADAVAKATDDHTLGIMINGNLTIAKLINPKIHYDPLKDLVPISLIATAPLALAAPANAPGATAQEFFAAARASGDRWSYGTPGVGTVAHIGMELLKGKAGVQPVHVPYPGNPQVINAIIGGQIQLALLPPAMAAAQARAGKLRVIGITSSGRSTLVPEYPSLAEAGVKDFNLEIWNAVAAPRSLPRPVVARLSALFSEIARSPDVRAKLFQQGWQVTGTTAEGLAQRIQTDARVLGAVIRSQGIKAE